MLPVCTILGSIAAEAGLLKAAAPAVRARPVAAVAISFFMVFSLVSADPCGLALTTLRHQGRRAIGETDDPGTPSGGPRNQPIG
ncbi:hypothetical protein GCM10027589_24640 [Actinocorallia lasiicapitis]